jgi:hypothetical protein
LIGLLWLDHILEQRRVPWRAGAIGLGLLAPWLIFGTLTFGSPIPGSIAAKSATYRLSPGDSLIRLIQHYSTPFFGHQVLGSVWQLAGFVVYLLLCAVGGVRAVRRDRRIWPLLAYPYVYLAVFAVANPLLFRWYLSPPLPFYFLFILAGVWALAQDVATSLYRLFEGLADRYAGRPIRLVKGEQSPPLPLSSSPPLSAFQLAIFLLFTAVALTFTLNAWTVHPDHGPARPAPEMAWFELELLYARAADVVLEHALPGDTLCAGDIGTLGYATDMPILDTVGLVTPDSRRYYPADPDIYVINYAIPVDLVLALDPDFVVVLEVYGRRGLLQDAEFQDRYRLISKLETYIYGSDGMLVFKRAVDAGSKKRFVTHSDAVTTLESGYSLPNRYTASIHFEVADQCLKTVVSSYFRRQLRELTQLLG